MPRGDHPDTARTPGPLTRAWAGLRWLVAGGWVEAGKAERAFERMHRRDRVGDRLHLALAMVAAAGLVGPTSVTEIAYLPLLAFFFVRVINAGPTWIHWLGQPVMLGTLALAAWRAIGLAWSPDRALGLDQMSELRWVMVGALIWPVIERRRWVVYALAAGFLVGNLTQVGHAIGRAAEIDWLTWPRLPHRNSGWWDPVVGGSLLTAALGLHLPAVLMGRGKARANATALSLATVVGLFATGTRGAWLASMALVLVVFVVSLFVRKARHGRALPAHTAWVGAVVALGAVGAAWFAAGDTIVTRAAEAKHEIAGAIHGDYSTDTGRRIAMAMWAGRAIEAHPFVGVGTGGYHAWVREQDPEADVHDHAHNALLQLAATGGIVGVALGAYILVAGVRGGTLGLDRDTIGTYDAAPLFALIGLLLAGAFDSIHLNTQTAALLGLLLGLCPCWRPGLPAPCAEKAPFEV